MIDLKAIIKVQQEVVAEYRENRVRYYSDPTYTRKQYLASRLSVGNKIYNAIAKVIKPTSTNLDWFPAFAEETVKMDEKTVPPHKNGITDLEIMSSCLMADMYGRDFMIKLANVNFNQLIGLNYIVKEFQEFWSVTDDVTEALKVETDKQYKKLS